MELLVESRISKKLRGGYYTPSVIAEFISGWAIRNENDYVLEPSCGDGEFVEAIVKTKLAKGATNPELYKSIRAVELYNSEAEKAAIRLEKYGLMFNGKQIHTGDFFQCCSEHLADEKFDCILGNPPFIRYQDFPEEQRIPAFALMKKAGLNPTRLTNTWIPFLIASTQLLKSKGRLGMVIPAELFQVNYAAETRKFLSEAYSSINIITFRRLVFNDVQQEVVLLLAQKNGKDRHGINVLELKDTNELRHFNIPRTETISKELDHSTEKWTQYFLDKQEIELLRILKNDNRIRLSGEYIDVDVGIVTGQNKFFVLCQKEAKSLGLQRHLKRIVSKSNHLSGITLSENDWNELVEQQYPNFLLDLPDSDYEKLPDSAKTYLDFGVLKAYNQGYKCRIRKRWWVVPSVWTPDAFMLRQVHGYPKLVLNDSNATATDTVHRVKFLKGVKGNVAVTAFLNSLTFAFSEVTGRSYGGGVLTFEPSEAEKLPLPMKFAEEIDFQKIDVLIRRKDIKSVLDITDNILLKKGLSLPQTEIKMLRNIWMKMRDRRINRRLA